MSWVTNTILHYANGTPGYLDRVNAFFEGDQYGFVSVKDPRLPDGWYGGSKHLECNLAIGAFNHLDLDGLIRHLRKVDPHDANLQLMVLEQEQYRFRIININDEPTTSE
ncbi:MAG TPA: hypothetical protein VF116_12115 [Ktedonobacterales bacterium]